MDSQIGRFKHCDPRFQPLLDNVLARVPPEVKHSVLEDKGLQIVADTAFSRCCALQFTFETPISRLIYLNPRLLQEADYRQIYMLLREIAQHVLGEQLDDSAADQQLIAWGFEAEVNAMRFDRAVADSKGFRTGYEWARRQSRQYLLQHFGIYFDDWNNRGLGWGRLPAVEDLRIRGESRTAVEELDQDVAGAEAAGISSRDAVLAGIMTAVKEIRFQEFEGDTVCRMNRQSSF
ncbi:MAG TPA: hypothetical protein ACFCUC_09150 [Desulfobacterales bacterium]